MRADVFALSRAEVMMSTQPAKHEISFFDDDDIAESNPATSRPDCPPPPRAVQSTPVERFRPFSSRSSMTPRGHRFEAEIDVAEIDERGRPGSSWVARGRELSRSGFAFMSRRMCYPGRHVIVAVHLIDASPVPLFGRVTTCEYEADGLCRVDIELLEVPEDRSIRDWVELINRRANSGRS